MIEFVNEITKSVKRRYNMLVTICIGSSCHLKGSRDIIDLGTSGLSPRHF